MFVNYVNYDRLLEWGWFPQHGCVSLHIGDCRNRFRFEWYLFRWACALHLQLADHALGESSLKLNIGIPLLGDFWYTIDRCAPLIRLLGLDFKDGKLSLDCRREVGFVVEENGLFVYLWRNSDDWRHPGSVHIWHPLTWLLGKEERLTTEQTQAVRVVNFPEGRYQVLVSQWQVIWRHNRWPWSERREWRSQVEVLGGDCVPAPGGQDVYTHCTNASTIEDALANFVACVKRQRGEESIHNSV